MQEKMEPLQTRIEQLEKRDESKTAQTESLPPKSVLSNYTLGEGFKPFGESGVTLGGFGTVLGDKQQNSHSSFRIKAFHLYVDVPLGEKFKSLAEMEFEDGGNVNASDGTEGKILLSRFWVNWKIHDKVNLNFGKELNSANGPYNLLYIHPLLPTATKPLKVNKARLQQQITGARVWGNLFAKDWEVAYWLGASNGSGPTPDFTDTNNNKMLYGRLQVVPPLGDKGELKVGIVGTNGKDGNLHNARENGTGVDLTYYYKKFGLWGEWYKSWVNPSTQADFTSKTFFLMGLYKLMPKWTAIVRYEENDTKSTAKTSNFVDGNRWVWAVNYRPIPPIRFGLEYVKHDEEQNKIRNNSLIGSVSMMF
ncbi:MAG: hypothetical protein HY559_03920 [Gammaproteobacteria bacterium]|nr:hypothetical protein [Gammaproteobacteria bacterium]